ncbi:MAG: protein kinase [Deltaproteobacteria bacterium]|nr:protein kinase [Deltaproteobacteria bacterium]
MPLLADRFALEHLVARNSVSQTALWRGKDLASDATVAIKLLRPGSPRMAARFQREAEIVRGLDHPAVIKLVDAGEADDGRMYLATEWLIGGDLAQVTSAGPLTVEETVALGVRIASGLAAAHDRGVVHRDVKPSNIFLSDCDPATAVLLDFGVAHRADPLFDTTAGAVLGTPSYMAPEQCRGETVDARADLFALGVVLYEIASGQRLYEAASASAAIARVLHDPLPTMPHLPDALAQVIAALLQKSPADRPASAAELITALRAIAPRTTTIAMTGEARLAAMVAIHAPPAVLQRFCITASAELPPRWSLDDGELRIAWTQAEPARDLCRRAASLALFVRASVPDAAIAIVTGRPGRDGHALEQRARLLARAGEVGQIRIDALTRGLLDSRFDIHGRDDALVLWGRRQGAAPRILGRDSPCVGRDAELRQLATMYARVVEDETPRAALVLAPAGAGKSRLEYEVRARLDDASTPPLVWSGFGDLGATETPFALVESLLRGHLEVASDAAEDAVRDTIDRAVAHHDHAEERAAIASGLADLLRLRPTERRKWEDPAVILDRAASALIQYVDDVARRRPLVLLLDDLHWADRPSLELIERLLTSMPTGRVLVIAFARPELLERFPRLWDRRAPSVLRLGPLSRRAAERMVKAALGDISDPVLAQILDAAEGNPFFLEELARSVSRRAESRDEITLPETVLASVQARLQGFAARERLVLRAASVFGLVFWQGGVRALIEANGDAALALDEALTRLVQLEVLVERPSSRYREEREFAFRHMLIREGAYAMLTEPDRVTGHRDAARWLEQMHGTDAVVVAEHYLQAGASDAAAKALLVAARDARQQVGFQHIADLSGQLLARGDLDRSRQHQLQVARAEALAAAGSGPKAAEAFLTAAGAAPAAVALELRRRAAEAYLRSGHVVDGLAAMTRVLDAVGERFPSTNAEALVRVGANRARLMLRGLGFTPRAEAAIARSDLLAVDACESIGTGIALIDYVRAAALQSRAALRALDLGEPVRVARAITYEACFRSARSYADSQTLLRQAVAMAAELANPRLDVIVTAAHAVTAFFGGRYRDVIDACDRTKQRYLTADIGGLSWEMTTAQLVELWSRAWLGQRDELRRQVPAAIQAAETRGDRFALAFLQTGPLVRTWLDHDTPTEIHRRIDAALAAWPTREFFLPHYNALLGHVLVDLHVGDGRRARARLALARPSVRRGQLHRVRQFAATLDYLEARACVLIGDARSAALHRRALVRNPLPWAHELAALVDAPR